MILRFCLPLPPSVNSYWRAVKGRNILSARGRQYQRDALDTLELCRSVGTLCHDMITEDVAVTLVLHFPDRRKRDIDNYCKAALDALTKGGVWRDDSQVKALHVMYGGKSNIGRVSVEIETL